MNKDVIYVEPEDDITDIISKIEGSKEKIVALVPPKKAGVFRSVVNIKLIAKAGTSHDKTIVLVTTDPSVIKLASATKIPVTKDLQTPPAVPTADIEVEETSEEEVVEEPEEETVEEAESEEEVEEDEDDEEEKPKKEKKAGKKEKKLKKIGGKTGNPAIDWIKSHKKIVIFGGIAFLVLLIFLIWAFAIAPSVTANIEIQTESKNFAENVSFTTKPEEEKVGESKLYLQEKKIETVQEVKFEATGQKNKGEKATGNIEIYAYFPLNVKASTQVSEGATFTISGLTFQAVKSEVLSYSGNGKSECANKDDSNSLVDYGCRINGTVAVIASEPGSKYNIAASSTGWDTVARVFAYSTEAMAGGTDDVVTVVEQSDIEKAKEQLESTDESENKKKLYDGIGEDLLIIESSFKQETAKAEATPAAGEEVKEGEAPVLKAVTTTSVYVIEKSKIEEFITEKAKLNDNQKIYEINDPFIENFLTTDSGFTGRLKTSYSVGPKVTDSEIVDIIKGKGIGDAVHELKNINGVIDVEITPSYPWVNAVPDDSNRITVYIDIKNKEK